MKLYLNCTCMFKISFLCGDEGGVGVCVGRGLVEAVNSASCWMKRCGESVNADKALLMYQPAHLSAARPL